MGRVNLSIPQGIVDALPEDNPDAARDMQRAVDGWERQINASLESGDDAAALVDAIERFERRWDRYDDFVVELRAWGQSPIYAMAWRDLHAAVIQQLYEDDEFADEIDRERNARIVEEGIRFDA